MVIEQQLNHYILALPLRSSVLVEWAFGPRKVLLTDTSL